MIPVSVVLPVLNEADSLPALLEALAGQSAVPTEIIFVDAGSTDGTPELIGTWASGDPRLPFAVHVFRCPGALPGAGRNHGVRAATQPWIAFLDGGLVPERDWLEQLFESVHQRAGVGVFGVCQFSADDPLPRALCAITNGYLARHPVIPASIFHRDVFAQVGPFREDLRTAEDVLWVRSFERRFGPGPICATALVHYRHYPVTLREALQKWRVSERSSVRAGVRRTQHVVYLLGMPLVVLSLLLSVPLTLFVFAAYLTVRGGFEPMRRSRHWRWWDGCGRAAALAFIVAIFIDVGKWIGIVEGVGGRLRRWE